MRLQILDNGHGFGTKALFGIIQVMSRQPVLDVVKLVRYRPDFYGKPMSNVTHEAMRGPSSWSVGDRELMAAFVAATNQCEFCTKAHTAVAQHAYGESLSVPSSFSDAELANLPQPLRATLLMLRKVTQQQALNADDMREVLAAGASRQQIEDALAVCFSFNVITRLADCFGFAVPGPKAFAAGAKYLISRGYT
ncbi:MAG: carboxymuconolactone decarboxylase family protein [Acidobacteria bacterium]|nr:carboxymuconolactone decarboxylase family protein [Acidobacteriota bacterium]